MEISRRARNEDTIPALPSDDIDDAPSRQRGRPKIVNSRKVFPKKRRVCVPSEAKELHLPVVSNCSWLNALHHMLDLENLFVGCNLDIPGPLKKFFTMMSSGVHKSAVHNAAIKFILKDTGIKPGEYVDMKIVLDAFSCVFDSAAGFDRFGERKTYFPFLAKEALPENMAPFLKQLDDIENSGRLLITFLEDRFTECGKLNDVGLTGHFETLLIYRSVHYQFSSAILYSRRYGYRFFLRTGEKPTLMNFSEPDVVKELSVKEMKNILGEEGCVFLFKKTKVT